MHASTPQTGLTGRGAARLLCCLVASSILACTQQDSSPSSGESPRVSAQSIQKVQEQHAPTLMAIPGVVGTAIGTLEDGTAYIAVFVKEETEELEARIPQELGGHPVRIRVSGEFRPFGDDH